MGDNDQVPSLPRKSSVSFREHWRCGRLQERVYIAGTTPIGGDSSKLGDTPPKESVKRRGGRTRDPKPKGGAAQMPDAKYGASQTALIGLL